jgi:hypothetical protein
LSAGECIFIDESGDIGLLPQSISLSFVIGYVYCKNPDILRRHLKHYLTRLHQTRRYPPELHELKFWLPFDSLKKYGYTNTEIDYKYRIHSHVIQNHTISLIREYSDAIQVAVLDKKTILKPTWTTVNLWNFMFGHTIFSSVLNGISFSNFPTVYYDTRTLSTEGKKAFHDYIQNKDSYYEFKGFKRYEGKLKIYEAPSHLEPCIWAADFVAGAYHLKFAKNDSRYAEMLDFKLIGNRIRKFWD